MFILRRSTIARPAPSSGRLAAPPLRIAYIVHTFHVGGLERCIARLVNHLDRRRFEPLIVCLHRNSDAAAWLTCDDVPIVELHKRRGNDPRLVWRLARQLRQRQVALVHSHNWGTLLETSIARRLAGVPLHVHAERGMELDDLQAHSLRLRLRALAARWAIDRADAVVAVAEPVKQHLLARCGKLNREVQVIPNGIDQPVSRAGSPTPGELRKRLGIGPQATLLGSVGRLAAVKDFPTAVRTLARLLEQQIDCHLVLVGDGPERGEIARQAQRLEVSDRVHLVGQQADVAAWLNAMDIYLNVSLNEGMSQSVLEAMACGLPLVVTDVGDNRRLALGDTVCGIVVPKSDEESTAQAVQQLVRQPALAAEFRRDAVARFQADFQIEAMIAAYETLYGNLANMNSPSKAVAISP